MKKTFSRTPFSAEEKPKLSLLCICCIIGLLLGRLADGAVSAEAHEALRTYLQQYASEAARTSVSVSAVVSAVITYLRYPVLLFLFGCTSAGIVLIPAVCLCECFFLSFAVSGFASALGRTGVMLAFSAFGIRCLITLPCIFMMALWAMDSAQHLRQERGRGRRRPRIDTLYGIRFAFCVLILLLGMAAELALMPRLLQASMEKLI